jgi:hypothetical protein
LLSVSGALSADRLFRHTRRELFVIGWQLIDGLK